MVYSDFLLYRGFKCLKLQWTLLDIGTGYASQHQLEQLPQKVWGIDSDWAPSGGCNSSHHGLNRVPPASCWDWTKEKYWPSLYVCLVENFCCQVNEMQWEVSRVHGTRDGKKEIEPRHEASTSSCTEGKDRLGLGCSVMSDTGNSWLLIMGRILLLYLLIYIYIICSVLTVADEKQEVLSNKSSEPVQCSSTRRNWQIIVVGNYLILEMGVFSSILLVKKYLEEEYLECRSPMDFYSFW